MSITQQLTHYWQFCRHSSHAYKVAQLLSFVIFMAFYLSYVLPFFDLNNPSITIIFTTKYLLEGITFILLTHFLLRPMLKNFLLSQQFSVRRLLLRLLALCLISLLFSAISIGLQYLPFFKITDMSNIIIPLEPDDTGLKMSVSLPLLFIMSAFINLTLFLVWSFGYGFWQMRQSRKALQQQVQAAQIQQLTNQLSPHFLFNAFNSIRALIYEDQDKAAHTVTQLSELFRFHLQAHLRPVSSLQDEWQLCQKYLQIEQTRLEERLQLEINIDDSLWQQQLPTLSLLTLAENAIKHGINPAINNGELHVTAIRDQTRWQLSVDNSCEPATAQNGTATGLKNIRQQLQLLHGDNARLIVTSKAHRFTVSMDLPYV